MELIENVKWEGYHRLTYRYKSEGEMNYHNLSMEEWDKNKFDNQFYYVAV